MKVRYLFLFFSSVLIISGLSAKPEKSPKQTTKKTPAELSEKLTPIVISIKNRRGIQFTNPDGAALVIKQNDIIPENTHVFIKSGSLISFAYNNGQVFRFRGPSSVSVMSHTVDKIKIPRINFIMGTMRAQSHRNNKVKESVIVKIRTNNAKFLNSTFYAECDKKLCTLMQEQGHTLITKNLSDLLGGKKLFTLKMNKFITIKTLDQKEFSPLAFSFKPFLLKNSNLIERPLSTKKIKINFKNYHVRKKQEELAKEKKQAELEKRREELYKKKRQERLKKRQELLKQKGSAAQGTNALKTTNDTKNK